MRHANDWEQLDLLDAIAEAEAKAKGIKELCNGWQNAVKNDNGVFTINTRSYPAGKSNDCFLELNVALSFPMVYADIDIRTGAPFYYGTGTPVDGNNIIHFSVYTEPGEASLNMTYAINGKIMRDGNLSIQQREKLYKLVPNVVSKAIEDMKNG